LRKTKQDRQISEKSQPLRIAAKWLAGSLFPFHMVIQGE
jgi:hypothetical protein